MTFHNVEFRGDLSEYIKQIYLRMVRLDPFSSFSELIINNIAIGAAVKGILEFQYVYGFLKIENSHISGNISSNSIFHCALTAWEGLDPQGIEIRNTTFESNQAA